VQFEKIQNTAPKMPELVMAAILRAIEGGQLKIGDDLPSERDLSELLGVGRGSLRESLAVLEFLGVVATRGNRKAVVRDASYVRNAMSFLRLSDDAGTLADFLEFRRINETAIARMACRNASRWDISRLGAALAALEREPQNNAVHQSFHEELASASHNAALSVVMAMVNTMMTELRQRNSEKPGYMPSTLEDHREIYEAVAARDEDRAEKAMLAHLQNIAEFCSGGA
jgi:GntR family transcriptional repressor for pyruvate dehydrogenase complex